MPDEQLDTLIDGLRRALDVERAAEMDAEEREADFQEAKRKLQYSLSRLERVRASANEARYKVHARCEAQAQPMFEADREIDERDYGGYPPDKLRKR